MLRACLAFAFALLWLPAVHAEDAGAYRFVDISRQESFEEQVAAIRVEMKDGGRFEFLKGKEKREVEKQFSAIAKVLEARMNAKLDDQDMLAIYAAQETANAILTKKDGRRMICENSAPTGTNVKELQCATLADRERAHKETRRMMRENLDKGQLALGDR
ncbi:MAG TPA: hypothetical protein VLF18_09610 [Tahibacter sp.]|uniref:hypothetical protein n=1 Tax=Tahibacter sp. TaxID=2056211 RepID=UPI002B9CCDA2|nr:hypothetical protein [Tahibacter sp.]HSX60441.1 hypothetical protein [Tahibacter sp.]